MTDDKALTHQEKATTTRQLVLKRFTTVFGAPPTNDPGEFLDEYVRALGGTEINLLTRAIDYVIDHTESAYGTWPTPGTLRAAVTTVAERVGAQHARKFNAAAETPHRHEPTAAQKARVEALMKENAKILQGGGWSLAKEKKKWAARQAAKAAGANAEAQLAVIQAAESEKSPPGPDVCSDAWERRYGVGRQPPQQKTEPPLPRTYKGGEFNEEEFRRETDING